MKNYIIEDYFLKNFVNLFDTEKKMVLSWRNSDIVRKNMVCQDKIELDDHLNFLNNLKNKFEFYFFLVFNKNKIPLGVISLKIISEKEKKSEFGIYLNPDFLSKGYGKILSNLELYLAFDILNQDKICLKVLENNNIAFNLYKKLGFKKTGYFKIDKMRFINMELKREEYEK